MNRKGRNGEEAQALVEFALFAMAAVYFLMGTIDFGRFLYYDNAIRSAARVGAEVATNHCPFAAYGCGVYPSAVSTNYVIWATYCEALSNYTSSFPHESVNLNLGQYATGQTNTAPAGTSAYTQGGITPCTPGTKATWTPTCANGANCSNCTNDICVAPTTRSSGTIVSVTVGYDFQPILPVLNQFFQTGQCWHTTDSPAPPMDDPTSNGHTLCAQSVGRVY